MRGLLRNLIALLFFPVLLMRKRRASPEGGWIHLEIEGGLVEIAPKRSFLDRREPQVSLHGVRLLVDEIIADSRVKGLVVSLQRLTTSPANRTAFRRQLMRLRDAGKQVVVHLPRGGSSPELMIASAANRVLMGTRTSLGPLGFKMGGTYVRGALDKLGVEPEVLAQGAYKTAGEPLMRTSMSTPQQEQLGRILDELEGELIEALATGRKTTKEQAKAWIDLGLVDADDALREGIIDAVIPDDALMSTIEGAPNTTTPDEDLDELLVKAAGYLARRRTRIWKPIRTAPAIGVIQVHGAIVEKGTPSLGNAADDVTLVKLLDAAREHAKIPGVVLHVDSPGGGVLASEKIYRAVVRLAEKKPVIACFSGVAASGGYYVSAPCHAIVAQPTTITGSIGVVAFRAAVGPLLARLGVVNEVLSRGAHADMMNLTRALPDDERKILESHLHHAYRDFVSLVAEGRKRSIDEILEVAGGRVWTGRDALSHGLVDSLGGLDEALAQVRGRLGTARDLEPVLLAPPTPRWPGLRAFLGASATSWLDADAVTGLIARLPTSLKLTMQVALSTRESVLAMWLGDDLP